MENKSGNWIKLNRRALYSSVFNASPVIWKVWCWCLMKASHKPYKFPFGGRDINMPAGSFITGRNSAVAELNGKPQRGRKKKKLDHISEMQYRTAIKYLIATNRITIEATNFFSYVYINNWHEYQDNNQHINQRATSEQPANNHIQEGKEIKEIQSRSYPQKNSSTVDKSKPVGKGAYAPIAEPNTIVSPEKFVEEYHRRKAQGWRAEYGKDLIVIGANNEIRLKIHNGQFVGYSDDLRKIIWKRSK